MRIVAAFIAGTVALTACQSGGRPIATSPAPAVGTRTTRPDAAPAPGSAKAAAKDGKREGGVDLAVPDSIAGFLKHDRKDYDDPAFGAQVRYRHPSGLLADVFVYPGPDFATDCPVDCAREVLKRELDQFPEAMRQQSATRSYRTLSRSAMSPGASDRWRLGERLNGRVHYADRPAEQRTEYWLVFFAGYRLKVRSTFDETPENVALVEGFLAAVAAAFTAEADDPQAGRGSGAAHAGSSATIPSTPGHPAGLYRAMTRR